MTNLEKWNFYLKDLESPQVFLDWTFYGMISAALQRRLWIGSFGKKEIYPNLYLIFIGPAGVGKSIAANEAKSLFKSFDGFNDKGRPTSIIKTAPDSVTLEALTRFLHNNYVTRPWPANFGKPDISWCVSNLEG